MSEADSTKMSSGFVPLCTSLMISSATRSAFRWALPTRYSTSPVASALSTAARSDEAAAQAQALLLAASAGAAPCEETMYFGEASMISLTKSAMQGVMR